MPSTVRRNTVRRNTATSLDRVLAVAAERFTSRRFEEVSISEIALAAHCSNSTIYDMFETKEGLYAAAIRYNARRLMVPAVASEQDRNPLDALIDRCRAWFNFALSPVTREMFLTIAGHSQKLHNLTKDDAVNPRNHWDAVKADVSRAVAAGFLRKLDHDTIVHHVVACTVYLPITVKVVWGERYVVELDRQLAVTFAPLLTRKGQRRIAEIIQLDAGSATAAPPG